MNESRVMSFKGGDITAWSDRGNINAGRGSRTAVNVNPPKRRLIGDVEVLVFEPPAVGSGIRALTYDPDGTEGPMVAPPAGDIYLFAPHGAIDAGEAGIAGGRVVLGATEVLNAQNISFSVGSVGVPSSSEGSAGLGALGGVSNVTQEMKTQDISSVAATNTKEQTQGQMGEQFVAAWLDVRVVSWVENETSDSDEEQ
ncbi:MAG: filamentous hemagglutinin family protein [Deltaproteobacteria bacterium]|nr:filamentous hemagglutinin family protein [Deltaproteobacteria bacterium]